MLSSTTTVIDFNSSFCVHLIVSADWDSAVGNSRNGTRDMELRRVFFLDGGVGYVAVHRERVSVYLGFQGTLS